MLTKPDVFEIIPVKTLIAVVFPAPLCPNKQNISDSYRDNDTLSTAFRVPNYFYKFLIIILGCTEYFISS